MSDQQARWVGFNYKQVPGLANRYISRYLRTQRKNMLRLFEERGLFALANRMKQIRDSQQDMLAKNRCFQQVLNEYAKLATPQYSNTGTNPTAVPAVHGSILQESTTDTTSQPEAGNT